MRKEDRMKKIRTVREHVLYKDERTGLYRVHKEKDDTYTAWMRKDEVESLILDSSKVFLEECRHLKFEK